MYIEQLYWLLSINYISIVSNRYYFPVLGAFISEVRVGDVVWDREEDKCIDWSYSWQRGKLCEVPPVLAQQVHCSRAVYLTIFNAICILRRRGEGVGGMVKKRTQWVMKCGIYLTIWVYLGFYNIRTTHPSYRNTPHIWLYYSS